MKNSTRQTTKQKTEINNNLEKIYCCYFNNTETIQIVQIKDSFFYFERTVFPSKTVLFEANKESFLEVHTLEDV
jgi:hypothetical protein